MYLALENPNNSAIISMDTNLWANVDTHDIKYRFTAKKAAAPLAIQLNATKIDETTVTPAVVKLTYLLKYARRP